MRLKQTAVLFGISAGIALGLSATQTTASAKTSGTTPTAIRGTFYSYAGGHKWTVLKITKHTASLSGSGFKKAFKITSSSKSQAHKLAYKYIGKQEGRKYFTLQAKLQLSAASAFPEGGMALTKRKICKHTYKVIRGYQGGSGFDYIKGHKVAKDYTHNAYHY